MKPKAQQIRDLLAMNSKMTAREIGEWVGVGPAYVRAVKQRMLGPRGSRSEADIKYLASPKGIAMEERRFKRHLVRMRVLRATGDRDAANAAGRAAYRERRMDGGTVAQSLQASQIARDRVLRRTGDKVLARQAYQAEGASQ